MKELSASKKMILAYLDRMDRSKGAFVSPSEIGQALGKSGGSAWASPKCIALAEEGYLDRSPRGHYRRKT